MNSVGFICEISCTHTAIVTFVCLYIKKNFTQFTYMILTVLAHRNKVYLLRPALLPDLKWWVCVYERK